MVVGPTIPTEYYTLRTPIILGMRISFIQLEVLIILEEYRVPTVTFRTSDIPHFGG